MNENIYTFIMSKKIDKFTVEREKILEEVFEILDIKKNGKIYLNEWDTNFQIQNDIIGISDNVRKYFICSKWSCFANLNVRRWWVSLIKSILKDMNYKLTPHKISTKMEDNTYKCLTYYTIDKK